MSGLPSNYVMVIERGLGRISFVDADTFIVAHQMQMDADIIDIAVKSDFTKAVVTSFDSRKLFAINLEGETPFTENTVELPTPLEDVEITPDDRFAISTDGGSEIPQNMVSYELLNQFTRLMPADAQAIAISPNWNGRMLTARYYAGRVRLYQQDINGNITDTGSESLVNGSPINVTYLPDGNFAFVADNIRNQIVVLDTSNPNYYGEASRIDVGANPQTILVSPLNNGIYVLTGTSVETFSFNSVSKRLTPILSFNHNLNIRNYFGVDQMTFADSGKKLFISGQNQLAVFDVNRFQPILLEIVQGVQSDGGLALGKKRCRLPLNTLAVTNERGVWYINPETFDVIAQTITIAPAIGIVVSNGGGRAFVTSGSVFTNVDLRACPPSAIGELSVSITFKFEDVAITPDNHFAVSVNTDFAAGNYFFLYDLRNLDNSRFVPTVEGEVAVAISPNGNGHMLVARYNERRVRLYLIDNQGNIADTGSESDVKGSPINLEYSPDGNFAFVANFIGNEIVVLDTSNPNYFGETSRTSVMGSPQTVIVSDDGRKVYVLTTQAVEIFNFDPVAERLTLASSFQHGVVIRAALGVDQMGLDTIETKLFILTVTGVAAFTTSGQLLGTLDIPDARGIAVYKY